MSASIAIPMTPTSGAAYRGSQTSKAAASSSSSYSSSPQTTPSPTVQKQNMFHGRRPSLLSTAISKQECTVINIGDPDGPPRLLSYLSSSQGYLWNPEIFLPPYVDCDYEPIENRRDPVHDIVLTDEESKSMLPQ
ncbi:hypothetical protein VD0002_g3465 [Verticillium dahliae]|uniref:Uncharacterized protein n=2 Tax=Verticillium dahliae TaxID=27337 RepID=G2WST0_VERDV|nr:uncharacterized protein VDAG_00861 [Verticillium dahliae VdLs.17]KAF3348802.1 NADH-cytochrome b5 reductase 2 [Verticillium dahliae VDG2]KAH6701729.1 hypothetical protein EV126DRAFT_513858 [Verticillium dahliae]EGY17179.1 hypothetical protein VDAG_00861 [Verticillium dahliae VdLs.17]PNH32387.1 hypothetical protein BJF96_g4194 [Verticillium dahliae]PNH43071.1 hypothetical protein VD0004_g4329 [Verticillium dahliae]